MSTGIRWLIRAQILAQSPRRRYVHVQAGHYQDNLEGIRPSGVEAVSKSKQGPWTAPARAQPRVRGEIERQPTFNRPSDSVKHGQTMSQSCSVWPRRGRSLDRVGLSGTSEVAPTPEVVH